MIVLFNLLRLVLGKQVSIFYEILGLKNKVYFHNYKKYLICLKSEPKLTHNPNSKKMESCKENSFFLERGRNYLPKI